MRIQVKVRRVQLAFALVAVAASSAAASSLWTPAVGAAKMERPLDGAGVALSDAMVIRNLGRPAVSGSLVAHGGASVRVRSVVDPAFDARIPTRGPVGSTSIAVGSEGILLAWSEEGEEGRSVMAQELRLSDGAVLGPPVVLAKPGDMGGSMHQPGVEVAWNGKEFGAVWVADDGGSVHFGVIRNGKLRRATLLARGPVAWPQVAPVESDFVVAWLDRSRGLGVITGAWSRGDRLTGFELPEGPHGAFDVAVDGAEVVVAADLIATHRTDQALFRFVPGSEPDFLHLGETWEREYDPSLTVLGDGALLLTRAVRNHADALELEVLRIDSKRVSRFGWLDLGGAQEVRGAVAVAADDGSRVVWIDDSREPWKGRHVLWSASLAQP